MNGAILLLIGILLYFAAYRFYGKYLSELFGINPGIKTPAHIKCDGIDYVPTKAPVLFGHHFASIAGAGPIVGPVLGVCFGWVPVALWIILGTVLIGAVHDFAALFISVRNEGRSIGHVIERHIGYTGRQIFLSFCFATLLLVISIFALLIAKTFVSSPSVATSSIFFIILALIFGFLVYRRYLSLLVGSLIFVPLLFAGIQIGVYFPLDLVNIFQITTSQAKQIWLGFLFIYIYAASVVPVWILLQPRDYLNSFLLYSMIGVGVISIFIAQPALQMPAFAGLVVQEPTKGTVQWSLFPILYVTVACGACSGFHALVSSGTTAKQLDSEKHILPIGYGAMLVEGILAIIALVSVAILTKENFISTLGARGAVNTFASGLANLSTNIGIPKQAGETFISLTISAFMLTTLDTATRLTRFTVQGLCLPSNESSTEPGTISKFVSNRFIATSLVIIISGYLAFSGEAGKIWPVFGASNQLLAALTLLVITLILIKQKKNFWIIFLPFLFMFIMSAWALGELFVMNLKSHDWGLLIATILLIIMAGLMVVQASLRIMTLRNDPANIEDQHEKAETLFKYNLKKQLILEDFFNLGKGNNLPVLPFIDKIEDYENIRIIRLKGAIDMSTIPEFSKMIPEDAKEEEKAINKNILLDFNKVTNVDSATIAILLVTLNSLKNEKRKLVLTNIPEDLKGMLDIAEIQDLFSIYDSEDKAYKDLKEEG